MYQSSSSERCYCKTPKNSQIHFKLLSEKFGGNRYKHVRTQTEFNQNLKAQEQIAELLTEVAVTLSQKNQLEQELTALRNTCTENNEKRNEERSKDIKEVLRLSEQIVEKDSLISKIKITHLEEQKIMLSQINKLKTELHIAREEKGQSQYDLSTLRVLLEHKLNVTVAQLKSEKEKNVFLEGKIRKYKYKIKYLTKYIKHLIEETNNPEFKKGQGDTAGLKRSSCSLSKPKCLSSDNISSGRTIDSKCEPDIESMVLSELFFKPSPIPSDIEELFFCSMNQVESRKST